MTPRPIPRELKRGAYEMKWRQGVYVAVGVALFLLISSYVGFVQELSYYILPLGYLKWISYGILAICAIIALCHILLPCRYVYIRDGKPIAARVLGTGTSVDKSGGIDQLCFLILADYRHPETNEICYKSIPSEKFTAVQKLERYSTTIEKGDYVTAVYLPGKLEKSLRIYGYLGLNPDVDFIRKDGKKITEFASLWKTLTLMGVIVLILWLVIGAAYAISFCWPLKVDSLVFAVVLVSGGLILGVISLIVALILNKLRQKSIKLIRCSILSAVAGGLLTLFLSPVVNSVFDYSEPEFREVEVIEFWQVTWDFLLRNYEIEYRELKSNKQRKYPATLEYMKYFWNTRAGAIEIKKGFLGWPWVRQIHPLVLVEVVQKDEKEGDLQQSNLENGTIVNREPELKVFVLVDEEKLLPISEEMQKRVLEKLQEHKASDESETE
jgi:hypothetical protein